MHASNLPVTYTHIHCKHAYSHTRKYRTDLHFHIKVPQIWVNYGMLKCNLFLIDYFSSSVFWSFFPCSKSSKLLPTPIYPTLCSFSLSFKKGREKQTKPPENVLVCNPQQHNENQISRRPIRQKNVLTKQCDRKHSQKYHWSNNSWAWGLSCNVVGISTTGMTHYWRKLIFPLLVDINCR